MTPPTEAARYKNHRFPGEIISHGVWLYYRFPLSYRDVQELLFERGIEVTHEAIRQWCLKFGQDYANQLKRRRAQPGDKWHLEVCQTQPVKMPWCPLRRFAETLCHLRGGVKREQEMHVHFFSRDDDFADQALRNGLPFCKREPRQIRPQHLAKGRSIVDHLLPLDALLSRVGQLSTFLRDLVQRGSQFLSPHSELT